MTFYYAILDENIDYYTNIGTARTKENAILNCRKVMVKEMAPIGAVFDDRPPEFPTRRPPKSFLGNVIESIGGPINGTLPNGERFPTLETIYVFEDRRTRRRFRIMSDGRLIPM